MVLKRSVSGDKMSESLTRTTGYLNVNSLSLSNIKNLPLWDGFFNSTFIQMKRNEYKRSENNSTEVIKFLVTEIIHQI